MPGYSVVMSHRSGRSFVVGGDYTNAEHARRDCFLRRVAHPRAHCVAAYAPNGVLLIALHKQNRNVPASR